MPKNYLIFPMKVMGITQTYDGTTSHRDSSLGVPADYPIDIAGKDTGREPFFCPCDSMEVVKIAGDANGNNHANGAWLVSTSEVDFADGTRDFVTIKFVHMNNSDFGKNGIYVGRVYKRGELIGHEGSSHATGNHIHMSAGKGKLKGSGWKQNNRGAWVITTTNGTAKPETLFFVNPSFTTIRNARGLSFKEVPQTDRTDLIGIETGEVRIKKTTAALALRSEPSTNTGTRFFYIPRSAEVSVISENAANGDGYSWDCVLFNGVMGYSANRYLV